MSGPRLLPHPPLLVVSDRRQARRPVEEVAARAFAGGCRWFLFRERDLPAAERDATLRQLGAAARRHGAALLVSGNVTAARHAAGVHLPRHADVAAARAALGPAAIIGYSAHDDEEAAAAAAAGTSYVTLSPIFPSASKPGHGPPLGLAALRRIAARTPVPVLALGGIDRDNARACLAAGAAGLAVMGAVMRAADPAKASPGSSRPAPGPLPTTASAVKAAKSPASGLGVAGGLH